MQYLLAYYVSPVNRKQLEKHHYHAQMIFSTAQMLALQAFRIRSAYIFAGITSFMLTGVAVRGVVGKGVYKYVLPFLLLVMGLVEAVTSVRILLLVPS
jgi:ABC-type transport system involved in cytochrome bd biosynthesis fused ATPase/permease subunit